MIDIENMVYTAVRSAVTTLVSDCYVTSEFTQQPEKFPCVMVNMVENHVYERTSDEKVENHARVVFQIEVFTAFTDKKKTAAKNIFQAVDSAMEGMKFVRTMYANLPNMDKTIYRITSRYRAIVAQPIVTSTTISGKTVTTNTYQIYNKE